MISYSLTLTVGLCCYCIHGLLPSDDGGTGGSTGGGGRGGALLCHYTISIVCVGGVRPFSASPSTGMPL